ncbi:REST corepressor [Orchesella cincta]|uniref:REST corepressor n=1 Tax=Orchesella cincta TaxID=48709 RepID=A0A1D2MBQ3_ORCCI|nr:REST corepressor [Orchesella cincta]
MEKQPRKTLRARRPSKDIAASEDRNDSRQHPWQELSPAVSVKKPKNGRRKTEEEDRKTTESSRPSTSGSKNKVTGINVGKAYQATLPQFISAKKSKAKTDEHLADLMWKPTDDLKEVEIESYISMAKRDFGYNEEQALGLLIYHDYDLERPKRDLANFVPFPA